MLAITNGYATDVFAYLNTAAGAAPTGLAQLDFTDGTVTNFEKALAGVQYSPTICGCFGYTGSFMNGAYLHDGAECWAATWCGVNAIPGSFFSCAINYCVC